MWCQFNPYVRLDGTSLCNGICFWCKHNRLSVQYIYIHLKLSLVILNRSYLFDNQIIKSISKNQLAWITKRSNHWFIKIIDYSIFDLYICITSLLFTKYSIIESQWTKKKQEGRGVSLPAQDLDIQLCTCISWYLLCLVSEDERWFVDIYGTVDHHCLSFLHTACLMNRIEYNIKFH